MLNMNRRPMLHNLVYVLCLVHVLLNNVSAKATDNLSDSSRRISKRNEVDLQFCVENFDIQEDTIIRTQDSRAMGAKYINETDLSSRDECLKLCCETTSCDVFVFEEKNPGSCYLFNCGPSDDFKCKFDQHTQYTSAILTVNRHAAELESEIQHSKHEQELTRLRAMPNEMVPSTASSSAFISTLPPPPKEANRPVVQLNSTLTKPISEGGSSESVAYGGGGVGESSSPPSANAAGVPASSSASASRRDKCSRYQFECRSTGECIAIYNACDGIPQCADGSDEGSELDCPSVASTSTLGHPRGGGQEETGHLHSHSHQQQKVAAVTTAGTHPITPPPPPQVSSQAMVHHISPAIEGYLPVRGPHSPQSVPSSVHQIPVQPPPFQPNWEEQQQQQQQMQLPSQYHSMGNGYNSEGGEARPPQYPSQHLPQQQIHMGYQGENFPLPANAGLRERPQPSQGSGQWPPVRSEPPLPPSPLGQDWFPHSPNDGGNMGPRYEESGQNRHIFNHKGSGLVADSDSFPYGDGNQGDYSNYANTESKNYIGSNENYFSTPYRQPVQPNWPLMHQKMASNGDPRQMGEPVKDPREEIARKHSTSVSSIQNLPHPNSAHGDYPSSSMQSIGGDGHGAGVPIPPDYFYEDGPTGGHHPSMSSSHRGGSYQRIEPPAPIHTPEMVQSKSLGVHHEAPAVQHVKQKSEPMQKEGGGGEDEGDEAQETGPEEGESVGNEKSEPKKAVAPSKHEVIKPSNVQHQSPIHMSLKHDHTKISSEENSDVPDGESSRPKGAVLSLILGMGITAIMVGLMAWRIRVIKRRLRRGGGKSPYAHDADYLLNGMYL